MGRIVAEGKIKEGNLNPQHEKLGGRVEGKTEDGCGMGDQPGPLPLERTHSPSPSIVYSK